MVSRSRSKSGNTINLRNLFLTKSQRSKSKSKSKSKSRSRSKSSLNTIMNIDSVEKALKQIQSIKSGEKNYTIHKGNWCGYCIKLMEQLKTLLQEFNKAGKKINIQITTVDEEHADMYNKMRTKNGLSPVEPVSSFPTIVREKSTGSPNQTNVTTVSQDELIQTVNSAATGNPGSPSSSGMGSPMSMVPGSPMSMAPGSPVANVPSGDPEAGMMDVPVNELEPGSMSASPSPIAPPSVNADILETPSSNPTVPPQMGGYGLYPAIASTAYHLAPAGILLATAAATFKCRKGRKGKKGKRVTRRRK